MPATYRVILLDERAGSASPSLIATNHNNTAGQMGRGFDPLFSDTKQRLVLRLTEELPVALERTIRNGGRKIHLPMALALGR